MESCDFPCHPRQITTIVISPAVQVKSQVSGGISFGMHRPCPRTWHSFPMIIFIASFHINQTSLAMDFAAASPQELVILMMRVTFMLTAAMATARAAIQRIKQMRRRRAEAMRGTMPGAIQPLSLNPKYRASRRELQRARREIALANRLRDQYYRDQERVVPPPAKRARTQYDRKDPADSQWYRDYVGLAQDHPCRDPESKQGRAFRRRFRVPFAIFEVMITDSAPWFPEHSPGTHLGLLNVQGISFS